MKTFNINGDEIEKLVRLDLAEGKNAAERLEGAGLTVSALGDTMTVGIVRLGSEAAKFGLQPGDEITEVMVPNSRPSRYWFVLPRFCCLA